MKKPKIAGRAGSKPGAALHANVPARREPEPAGAVLDLSGASDRNAAERTTFSILSEARHRQKLVRIAEALREEGVDEPAIAKTFVILLKNLLCGDKPNGSEKLLADVVKELTRLLEPPGSAGASDSDENPLQIRLIHNIPRPWRPQEDDAMDEGGEECSKNA